MKTKERSRLGGLLLATTIAATTLAIPALSQDANQVLLDSADGSIDIVGELREFNDAFYVIETSLGVFRVSAERVRCDGDACPAFETLDADVRIAGSGSLGVGLLPLLIDGFSSELAADAEIATTNVPGQVIATVIGDDGFGDEIGSYLVSPSNTSRGFEQLLDANAQITMASRRILPEEARALRSAGAGNMISPSQEHIVAVDSIVVVVNRNNPVQSLTIDEVSDIYAGRITNWRELGGEDLPIAAVGHEEGSEIRRVFEDRILPNEGGQDNSVLIASDYTEASAFVGENPGAIGYVGMAFLRGTKPISLVNECNIAMVPDTFSSKTEEYSLQRRMYLYTRGDVANEAVDEFLSYAVSESADNVILKSGFIDLGIERQEQGVDSDRYAQLTQGGLDQYEQNYADQMLGLMADYDRLSTTFRFRTGSSRLDERGRFEKQRLISYLAEQPEDVELLLVGFTDDVGAFSPNVQLSESRAGDMAADLREAVAGVVDNVSISSTGFGPMAPVACNVNDRGRAINRRVEVWIKRKDI